MLTPVINFQILKLNSKVVLGLYGFPFIKWYKFWIIAGPGTLIYL